MKRNEPGIDEGGKIVANNNAKGNVPGIGKGGILAANIIGRETGQEKEAKLQRTAVRGRKSDRGIEKGGEIAANNAKRNGSGIDRIDKQDAKENSKGKESSSQSETVAFQQKVTTVCLFLLSYR